MVEANTPRPHHTNYYIFVSSDSPYVINKTFEIPGI